MLQSLTLLAVLGAALSMFQCGDSKKSRNAGNANTPAATTTGNTNVAMNANASTTNANTSSNTNGNMNSNGNTGGMNMNTGNLNSGNMNTGNTNSNLPPAR